MTAIEIKQLTKRYKDVTAVDGLSLRVEEGELFSLLGVNGAGKTTTIKMLSCLTVPTEGDAFLLGHSIRNESAAVKSLIAVSPQETAIAPGLSVKENLELMCGIHGFMKEKRNAKIQELTVLLGLNSVMNKKAGKLSGGWQRRLSIAMALISEPKILFLDEPTLGLDVLARSELWDLIRSLKGKVTIILTTHYMEEAEALSDRIAIMKDGKLILCDTAEKIKEAAGTDNFEHEQMPDMGSEQPMGGDMQDPNMMGGDPNVMGGDMQNPNTQGGGEDLTSGFNPEGGDMQDPNMMGGDPNAMGGISTKAGYQMWDGPYGDFGSRKYLLSSLDASLKRLGLDYVDVFYHHRPDPDTPLEETMGALDHAVKSGKALYAGLSNYNGETMARAAAILRDMRCPFVINQNRYSIFDRTVEKNGLLDAARNEKKGVIIFSPLAQGLLTDRYLCGIPSDSRIRTSGIFLKETNLTEEKLGQISALDALAKQRGESLAQMALAWVLRREEVTSVLVGASKPSQILDNLGAMTSAPFSAEELSAIDSIVLK